MKRTPPDRHPPKVSVRRARQQREDAIDLNIAKRRLTEVFVEGCGCVFCDLKLARVRDAATGDYFHQASGSASFSVKCTKPKKARPRPVWSRTTFGMSFNVEGVDECDVMVVAVNGGEHHQLQPVELLLPHQLYKGEATKLMRRHNATELWVLPLRSKDYRQVPVGKAAKK